MVPLYVTAVGYRLLTARNANEAYWRLARVGYLSLRALRNRRQVVSLIERTEAAFCSNRPEPFLCGGGELWHDIEAVLDREDYLSALGRSVGRRFVKRSRRWWQA